MKNKYKIKWLTVGVAAMLLAPMMAGGQVSAWGPERPTYKMSSPADHPVFNSIIDNPSMGDERDFVRIVEADSDKTLTSELAIEPGKEYAVSIYFHNDASATYNTAAQNRVGIALGTRVVSYFPEKLGKFERGKIDGVITAANSDPKTVWDEAYITAREALTIEYVEGSARIYNDWKANNTELSKSLFTADGVTIGLNELNGMILGCEEYSGRVMYRIRTVAVETPEEPKPDPEPEPTPDPEEPTPEPSNPEELTPEPEQEKPQELPETGPAEVALAIVVVLALVAGIVYWRRTSHAVKKATRSAKGYGKRK